MFMGKRILFGSIPALHSLGSIAVRSSVMGRMDHLLSYRYREEGLQSNHTEAWKSSGADGDVGIPASINGGRGEGSVRSMYPYSTFELRSTGEMK
jgi:hypothetical protein